MIICINFSLLIIIVIYSYHQAQIFKTISILIIEHVNIIEYMIQYLLLAHINKNNYNVI